MLRQQPAGSPRERGPRRGDALAYLALLLVAWAFFAWRIQASIAAGLVDNTVFGADAADILFYIDLGDYRSLSLIKHPLAVLWAAVTIAPLRLLGIDSVIAASLSFGLAGGLVPTLTILLARLWHVGWLAALAATALATCGFATLTILSIIESYAITLAMIPATLIALTLMTRNLPDGWFAGGWAGVAAAIAGWANLPLAALVLAYPALRWRKGIGIADARFSLILPLVVATLGAVVPTIAMGLRYGFDRHEVTIAQWTSLYHFIDGTIIADYFTSALAFGAVSPDLAMQCRYPVSAMASVLTDPLRLVALITLWLLIVGGAAIGWRNFALRPVTIALIAIIVIWLIFFLWFAPFAALLFAGQWWLLLALLALPLLARSRSAALFALMLSAMLGLLNAPVLTNSPIDDFAAACPTALQINGGI